MGLPDLRAWRTTSQDGTRRPEEDPEANWAPNRVDTYLAGYAAPFPSNEYIAGPRIFPQTVATQLRQNTQVMENFYTNWDKPLLTAFGSDDPAMAGRDEVWQTTVPGAQGQSHTVVEDASHFIQDDKPDEISRLLIEFINAN